MSSGTLRPVDWYAVTDVSESHGSSTFRTSQELSAFKVKQYMFGMFDPNPKIPPEVGKCLTVERPQQTRRQLFLTEIVLRTCYIMSTTLNM